MIDRICRAIVWGIGGTIIGFYAVAFAVEGFERLSTGHYDPSCGMAVGFIAIFTGCPLGFTFGAIFGFRVRKPKKLNPTT
jgi:hypothetical protein